MEPSRHVDFEDLAVGTGADVRPGDAITIRYDLYLNRGECLERGVECTVDLGKRERFRLVPFSCSRSRSWTARPRHE